MILNMVGKDKQIWAVAPTLLKKGKIFFIFKV